MALFNNRKKPQDHPAYNVGFRLGHWLMAREKAFGQWLNQGQFVIGFRWRNALITLVLLIFLAVFIGAFLR